MLVCMLKKKYYPHQLQPPKAAHIVYTMCIGNASNNTLWARATKLLVGIAIKGAVMMLNVSSKYEKGKYYLC